ncbi:MAG: hypothetical protein ABIA59_05945, partial [Candidatus Latescibacterota bacterium]
TFEDEERNLLKEITVWVIGAAFVSYFIIKVFLEGDTNEPDPDGSGKKIPGGGVTSRVLLYSF